MRNELTEIPMHTDSAQWDTKNKTEIPNKHDVDNSA